MQKRTKIIATVGPVTASAEKLIALFELWINIIRFNFSHADHATAHDIAQRIHDLNQEGKTNLSLLLDTKWPELRTGDVDTKIQFHKGDIFRIYTHGSSVPDGAKFLTCDYEYLVEDVSPGQMIEIDSGLFHVQVVTKWVNYVEVEAQNDAMIWSRRHVNLPGVKIRLPGITDKDKSDILFAIQNGYDFIAASFIRTADNVREIRQFLEQHHASHIQIISKIENQEWIDNLESIVQVSDGVMVARGDLGIEVPIEKVPKYQKRIIDLCRENGKFVIVATHMLESMIEHPFPTRAEVSDIFRAVLQWADTTMLSGETTTGKYPLESVMMMSKVIQEAEESLEHKHHEYSNTWLTTRDIEKKMLIRSALHIADDLGIEHILLFTRSGRLARLAAAYRPNLRIHAFTSESTTLGTMRILYGIEPYHLPDWTGHEKNLKDSIDMLLQKGIISLQDRIIAITDISNNQFEIPVLEIITIHEFLTQ
jgi:pyruvate kinase